MRRIINPSKAVKFVKNIAVMHGPELLIGIGISGMLTATVMAVKATPKAMDNLEKAKQEKNEASDSEKEQELTVSEKVKATWKCYAPAVAMTTVSIFCIVGASSINIKRNAALATAYSLSESTLKEYQNKVVETFGEKEETKVRDSVAKDKIDNDPLSHNEIIITGKGKHKCYDATLGGYFESDIEEIRKSINTMNQALMNEMYISVNEFFYELGRPPIEIGDDIGWNIEDGLIDVSFSSQLADDGTPCLVMSYHIAPRYEYKHLM